MLTVESFYGVRVPLNGNEPREEVTLTEFDPDGEIKIVASALYAVCDLPDDQLLAVARRMSADDRLAVLQAYAGQRTNRRHKPGRAFERVPKATMAVTPAPRSTTRPMYSSHRPAIPRPS